MTQAELYNMETAFLDGYHKKHGGRFKAEAHIILEQLLGVFTTNDYNYRRVVMRAGISEENKARLLKMVDSGGENISHAYRFIGLSNKYAQLSGLSKDDAFLVIEKRISEVKSHKGMGLYSKILADQLEHEAITLHETRAATRAATTQTKRAKTPRKVAASLPDSDTATRAAPLPDSDTDMRELREKFTVWVDAHLNRIPEQERLHLRRDYLEEFRLTTSHFKRAIMRKSMGQAIVNRKALNLAFDQLELVPFKSGLRIDLKLVSTKYKRLALEAHPDRGGNETMFHAITDAYDLIKDLYQKHEGVMP
jgi:hypothetical protein